MQDASPKRAAQAAADDKAPDDQRKGEESGQPARLKPEEVDCSVAEPMIEAIVGKLNAALRAALATQIVERRFAELTSDLPKGDESSPEHVAPREIDKCQKLLK